MILAAIAMAALVILIGAPLTGWPALVRLDADRPCFQTVHGRPLFVETGSFPSFSQRSLLAVHAYWVLLPLCSAYALIATPFWLLTVSVIAVVAGAVHVLRIMRTSAPAACWRFPRRWCLRSTTTPRAR